MKETMTVHKGLCELKLLDSRINKEIGEIKFVVVNKHNNQKIDGKSIADFCAYTKEKYQSICTLINRRNAIKRAITRSNACTYVTIAGQTYTVAEAIDMKSVGTGYLRSLLGAMHSQYTTANKFAEKENGGKLDDRANDYMSAMYSGSELKNMSDEINKVREAFVASQTLDIIDPLNAAKEMETIKDKIDAFMADVDSELSVSNALTTISVEYETA